ncbi:polyhomeotic-like protein 3 isoform X2 [Carettochelys insculpta]|uniref:polyhomeotic-like protein 3 isoform X2 n=1 Tax=Carettochelys insculpta TaxID=44489 RepID=UPI003EBE1780
MSPREGGEKMAEAEMKENCTAMENETNATTCSSCTTSTTTITTSSSSSSSSRTQPPHISVYSGSDRHAVQVIQQALHRPPSSAAQYLQQMYAAQQQHLMLQTAALQQQHLSSTQFQSLAAVPQASLSGGRQCASPTGSVTQQSSMSQTSINLSTSPTPAQLISHSQTSNTTSSSITQQTMLLGSTSPTLSASQAQMYLRAQMLIFTPATTVAAVQSDIPVVSSSSSSSCQSAATQVQNLTLRSQKLGVVCSSQNGPPKSSSQAQSLALCTNKTVTSTTKATQPDSPDSNRKGASPTSECRSTSVTRTSSIHQLIAPASYSAIQPHSLIKHQQMPLHSPPPKISHHQLILQQQQQVQPITLQTPPSQEPPPSQHYVPLHSQGLPPVPNSVQSQRCSPVHIHPPPLTVSPTPSQSAQQSVVVSPTPAHSPSQSPTIIIHPQALVQSQPHPLMPPALQSEQNPQQPTSSPVRSAAQQLNLPSHLTVPSSSVVHIGPVDQPNLMSPGQQIVSPTPHQQYPTLQSVPIPVATPPQLSTSPTQIQQLPLQSVQSLQMQPEILSQGQVLVQNTLVSEEELPAAEALVQLPFQTLPPPQTVAVNLQVQPSVPVETPVIYQMEHVCEEEMPEESDCVRMVRTPTPPTLSPPVMPLGNGEELASEEPLSEQVASSVSASVIKSPSDPSHASIPAPPLLLPIAATRSNITSMSNSIPSLENKPPQAIVKPQILTHVIEGFVIQEGLEPFPVSRSSLLVEQPAKKRLLMESQVMSVVCVESELQNSTKHAENSSDTEIEDMITEEGLDEMERDLLKCEFCGKMGYPNKFLRSKRFCSTSCAKRHSSSCNKKYGLFASDKNSRWSRKSDSQNLGRHGRQPSGPDGPSREHFLRQRPINYPSAEVDLTSHEDAVPPAMTTRLRRQSERERERELRELKIRKIPENVDLLPSMQADPSTWTVDEVWAFIRSLPAQLGFPSKPHVDRTSLTSAVASQLMESKGVPSFSLISLKRLSGYCR